jgi:predicted RNA-binding protein (virulence factor B family)
MRVLEMALVGRYNSLQVVKHTNFGLYLDGGADGEILLPNRYIPKDIPTEDEDWLNVFVYLDSEDKLLATTEKPKVQVGEFASLKVVEVNSIGVFLDWGLPKDLLLPYSEEKRQMTAGEYCVVHVYLDKHTRRITATARLDRYLDKTPANYSPGQEVDLLVAEATDMGFKAIINNKHWGLIHKNEIFKFMRAGMIEKGYIKEVRADGKIALSLQPVGQEAASSLNSKILSKLRDNSGTLPVSDKSDPALISSLFGVSKGNFKKAIGSLYKEGKIVIHADRIELT